MKKLQAVCKDVQANKRTKKNPPVCTAQCPSINQVKTTTTTSADSSPILPRANATVTQPMSYPVQLMVPMNTLLIPTQQGAGGVGVVHVPQVAQPQAVPVTVPQVVPVSLPPLIQSLQSLIPSSNDAVMPTLIPQNGMSEEMENPMAVNNEFGKVPHSLFKNCDEICYLKLRTVESYTYDTMRTKVFVEIRLISRGNVISMCFKWENMQDISRYTSSRGRVPANSHWFDGC